MSELRHDPLNRRWVIIASDRGQRPSDFELTIETPAEPHPCPFCEGCESQTPPEIHALRPNGSAANTAGWSVRVVPNRYPTLAIEGQPDRRGVGMYDRMHGIGAHEVIVESPHHGVTLADQPPAQLLDIVTVWRDRVVDLMRDSRFKYVLLFKNKGAAAGATMGHPHAQIIATPVTPRAVAAELDASLAHHQLKERCLICDIITQEIEDGRRIVSLTNDFVVFTPFASRFPFELFLAPRRHSHEFGHMPDTLLPSFAASLADALTRIKLLLRDAPYNFVVHTAPNTAVRPRRHFYFATIEEDWHWHLEILPRLTRVAGFEWGTGLFVNPTGPEDAAKWLREVEVSP